MFTSTRIGLTITLAALAQGPTTNKRSIRTTVLVEDSQILVLGGLIDDTLTETEQKVVSTLDFKKSHPDSSAIREELDTIRTQLQLQGVITKGFKRYNRLGFFENIFVFLNCFSNQAHRLINIGTVRDPNTQQ